MNAAILPPRVVLYEGRGATPLPATDRGRLVGTLLDRGYAVTLAGPSAATAATDAAFVVIGCFAGNPPDVVGEANAVCDITGQSVDAAVQAVEAARGDRRMNRPDGGPSVGAASGDETWKPWFPVIDPARCTNCMQCLSFCLFDVYGVSEDHRLQVENPANCKVNCPACSRVCPDVAIMFPKYHAGPIDGGPVSDADVTREKMKVDISALLGGDLYAKLRERSSEAKKRFSRERSADQALAERRRCLTKLADAAAIPREVLDALPSAEEIQQRAEAAAARAAAARAAAEASP
jgi:NAD-dependent dihydropyrimidine dehydrogenase PreA subunit